MRLSIFNPCTGTADQIDVSDAASAASRIWPFTDDDELMRAREARLAEVRALIEAVAEPVAAAATRGVH
jgi:hypothetical protein